MMRFKLGASVVLLVFIGFSIVLGGVVDAATTTKTCYNDSDDADSDNYAKSGAPSVSVQVQEGAAVCPAGYVPLNTDCDDTRSGVHPFNSETARNGIDDNCNGSVDEPEFVYYKKGNENTASGFSVKIDIKDSASWAASLVGVKLEVSDLETSSVVQTVMATSPVEVESGMSVQPVGTAKFATPKIPQIIVASHKYANVVLGGLSSGRVYRVKAQFYDVSSGITYGAKSQYYYSATAAPRVFESSDRLSVLLEGFKQYDDSQRGKVGINGSVAPGGTRYGAADGEAWCSEFYVWLVSGWLEGISGITYSTALKNFFDDEYNLFGPEEVEKAVRGDYLAFDWDGDGVSSHSGMFLALEESATTGAQSVWSLDGNVGSKVGVQKRDVALVNGIGHVDDAMTFIAIKQGFPLQVKPLSLGR